MTKYTIRLLQNDNFKTKHTSEKCIYFKFIYIQNHLISHGSTQNYNLMLS